MAREPDVELFKGYHSYAVRTSPVTPATDYEEEQFPENEPPSPEPRGEPQRRAGTPGLPREEKPAEAKAEAARPKEPQQRPKEPQQRPSPERRAGGRAEPAADRKTEARAPGRTEPKAGAKRGPAPAAAVVAAQKAEECEEVIIKLCLSGAVVCNTLFFLQGPNTIVICMVILLNIGLAILFVHFLT
ncbi:Junctophilin-2 [Lonchura striata]|uniref:Junctophilin-2 n=1 Tax=Lonchura striata TaxID=40157 RepID=A0A218UFF4_9PASE|nr:Junctophilin-2 [Lonchura striata domestica]